MNDPEFPEWRLWVFSFLPLGKWRLVRPPTSHFTPGVHVTHSIRTALTAFTALALAGVLSSCNCNGGTGTDGGTGGGSAGGTAVNQGGGSATLGGGTATGGGSAVTGGGSGSTGGGTSSTGGGSAAGGGTSFDFATQAANALCQRALDCHGIVADSLPACRTFYNGYLEPYGPAVAAAQVQVDATAAAQCVQNIAATPCTSVSGVQVNDQSAACSTVLVGLVNTGGRCNLDQACTQGNGCTGAACLSTCQPRGAVGQRCRENTNSECDTGLWCDRQPPTYLGTCRLPATVDAGCAPYVDHSCANDLKCNTTTNVCVPLPTLGQPCPQGECSSATYCNDGICTQRVVADGGCFYDAMCASPLLCRNNFCQPGLPVGSPCTAFNDCANGAMCDEVLRTCQLSQQVDAGASCTGALLDSQRSRRCGYSPTFESYACRGAAVNSDGGVGTLGVCAPHAVGDVCRYNSECPRASYCSGDFQVPGTCMAAAVGTPCTGSSSCRSSEFCQVMGTSNTCQPKVATNQVCIGQGSCLNVAEACTGTPSMPTDLRCRPIGGAGTPCIDSSICTFGFSCQNGVCAPSGVTGTECLMNSFCVDGACKNAPDGGEFKTCQGKQPDTTPCTMNLECTSGYCDRPTGRCASMCQ